MPRTSALRDVAACGASLVALVSCPAGPIEAAGFALREYGLDATASAFAGASAQADAPGFLATNPAASSGVAVWDAQFTLNAILPSSQAELTTATTSAGSPTGGPSRPAEVIGNGYEPGFALRLRLAERWTAGFAISAPWGLGTEYAPGWAGRYYALEAELLTLNLAPSVAYRVRHDLVVSAGLQAQYANGRVSNAIDFGTIGFANGVPGASPGAQDGFVAVDASDWGFGFVVGALWQPRRNLSLGAFYRSAIEHELEGTVDFVLDSAGTGAALSAVTGAFVDTRGFAQLTTPAVAQLGVRYDLTPEWALLAEAGFTEWSEFRELRVRFANPSQPDSFQLYAFEDAWMGALGVRFQPRHDWILRAGVAFDESPTRDGTRDPRIPDADRAWLACGVHHELSAGVALQVGYARLIFRDGPIALSAATAGNEARGNLVGRTEIGADVISLQITVRR